MVESVIMSERAFAVRNFSFFSILQYCFLACFLQTSFYKRLWTIFRCL